MTDYRDLGRDSGVLSFEILPTSIIVKFKTQNKDGSDTYEYSYLSAGQSNVEYMKQLALQGQGLNSFIMRAVKDLYERKW